MRLLFMTCFLVLCGCGSYPVNQSQNIASAASHQQANDFQQQMLLQQQMHEQAVQMHNQAHDQAVQTQQHMQMHHGF